MEPYIFIHFRGWMADNLICRVPQFLQSVEDPRVAQGGALKGCPVCGGLGHGIANCPKLEDTHRRTMAAHRGDDTGGGY
jgi:ATP-dependent RNA helicase DDX41